MLILSPPWFYRWGSEVLGGPHGDSVAQPTHLDSQARVVFCAVYSPSGDPGKLAE